MKANKTIQISVTIPEDILERVTFYAGQMNVSRSHLISLCIKRLIDDAMEYGFNEN